MAEFQGIIKSKTKCEPSVFYKNLKIKPLSCLPLTIWLKRSLVNCKKAINISICPIYGFKSSAISHLKFDTLSLVNRLFHQKDQKYVSNNIGAYKNAIWTKIISVNGKKMLKRALKHKLLVGEMVTNGHSVSLLFCSRAPTISTTMPNNAVANGIAGTGAGSKRKRNRISNHVPQSVINGAVVVSTGPNRVQSTIVPPNDTTVISTSAGTKRKRKSISNNGLQSVINDAADVSTVSNQVQSIIVPPAVNGTADINTKKLQFANLLYEHEVNEADELEHNTIPPNFESIAQLEAFADQSFRDKNAPYIPYIHQISTSLKNEVLSEDQHTYGVFDLGVRDIFKMLTIPQKEQRFHKPSPKNSISLTYSSKCRQHNLQVKQRAKWLDNYKQKNTINYEGETYSIKKFESEIVKKKLHFKDSSYQDFLEWSKLKSKFESVLRNFHEKKYLKYLKYQQYQSEMKEYALIANKIKTTLGKKCSKDCILIVGDVSISTHLRGNRPACWKGLIRYLKKAGFKVLRIEEYHSSKLCCNCRKFDKENKSNCNWFKCQRSYGKQKGKSLPVYSLFKCVCCGSIKQRDLNAVVNMYENGIQQLHGVFMPEFVIPDGVREKWLLNPRNFSHAAFKDKYQCY